MDVRLLTGETIEWDAFVRSTKEGAPGRQGVDLPTKYGPARLTSGRSAGLVPYLLGADPWQASLSCYSPAGVRDHEHCTSDTPDVRGLPPDPR